MYVVVVCWYHSDDILHQSESKLFLLRQLTAAGQTDACWRRGMMDYRLVANSKTMISLIMVRQSINVSRVGKVGNLWEVSVILYIGNKFIH